LPDKTEDVPVLKKAAPDRDAAFFYPEKPGAWSKSSMKSFSFSPTGR